MTTSEWVQISSTLFLAFVAFIAPTLVERWKIKYRSPNLRIKFRLAPPYCHQTEMRGGGENYPVYYFRFLVINTGKSEAKDCEAFLEKIYKENSAGDMVEIVNFSPVNLKWSGARDPFKKTIYPDKEVFCDIGRIQHPDHNFQSVYKGISIKDQGVNKFAFELPERYYSQWDCLLPGKYKIKISVYSKNSKPVSRQFPISWTGEWKDEQDDMFSELVIT